MTAAAADEAERTAAVVERLGALLAGGAAPTTAWQHVAAFAASELEAARGAGASARGGSRVGRMPPRARSASRSRTEPVEILVARRLRSGVGASNGIAHALHTRAETSWRALGCAWSLAETTGAPLAAGLVDLAQSFRDFAAAEREIELALAGPMSATRLVMALPAVGVLLGLALGFDSLQVLFGTPIGWGCLGGSGMLMLAAHLWNRALLAAASHRSALPGFALDLTALGMLGGAAARQVAVQVSRALVDAELVGARTGERGVDRPDERVRRTLELAEAAGIPAAALLRSEAALARRTARSASSERAARLGVRLMLPLGVCVLPSFLLVGVAPLILAVVTQTITIM